MENGNIYVKDVDEKELIEYIEESIPGIIFDKGFSTGILSYLF